MASGCPVPRCADLKNYLRRRQNRSNDRRGQGARAAYQRERLQHAMTPRTAAAVVHGGPSIVVPTPSSAAGFGSGGGGGAGAGGMFSPGKQGVMASPRSHPMAAQQREAVLRRQQSQMASIAQAQASAAGGVAPPIQRRSLRGQQG